MNPSNMQLVVVGSSHRPSPAYHTIRYAGGGWQGAYGNVNDQESNGAGLIFSEVAAAGINGDLHVVARYNMSTLYHTIRAASGGWQGFFGNINEKESNAAGIIYRAVDVAGTDSGLLHVVVVTGTAGPDIGSDLLLHTFRDAQGNWQNSYFNINGSVSNGTGLLFLDVGCTAIGGELHIVALERRGGLYYIIRSADGSWQSSFTVIQGPPVGSIPRISCAAINGDVHIIVGGGDFWHTTRFAGGHWQASFEKVNDAIHMYQLSIQDVGCANVGGDLHVVVLNGNDYKPWHTIRFSSQGTWQDLRNVGDQLSNSTVVVGGALSVGGTE